MNTKLRYFFPVLLLLLKVSFQIHAQGTAFTYQGRLNALSGPATGTYDFAFTIYDSSFAGNAVAGPVTNGAVSVSNGLFTTTIDFGSAPFNGSSRWLDISVRTNGSSTFFTLSPRQAFTPTPYSITAATITGPIPAQQLAGTVPSSALGGTYNNQVTLNNANNQFSGAYSGNGAGVTNVNAIALNGLPSSNFWQLGGNIVANGQVMGSTNNQSLEIRVNNRRAMLITPSSSDSPNIVGGAATNSVDGSVKGSVIAGGGTSQYIGGAPNRISADFSAIGGGDANWIQTNSDHSVIAGGITNYIGTNARWSVIGGGIANVITNNAGGSIIAGGQINFVRSGYGFIGGGYNNIISNIYGSVVGGLANVAGGSTAFVGGGNVNVATGSDSFVGGGLGNHASGDYSTVGGGASNSAMTNESTVGGGTGNTASGPGATISGGGYDGTTFTGNTASGGGSAIGGGNANTASGLLSDVTGGNNNQATNQFATVAGGQFNTAGGTHSFAAGRKAVAAHNGSFVWADETDAPFTTTADDQFLVRANGGVGINTNNLNGSALNVLGNVNATSFSGDGGNLTNLNAAQLTGTVASTQVSGTYSSALTLNNANNTFSGNTLTINGNKTGGWPGPVVYFNNSSTAANASPALRVTAGGATADGALNVSATGTGLIARFGNAVAFVADITTNGIIDANAFSGNGSALTGLNASQVTSGTLPSPQLSGTYSSAITLNNQSDNFTGAYNVSTNGSLRLNDRALYFRTSGDANHGLAYNGAGITNFGTGNVQVDGPVLWGFSGGALGVMNGGAHAALTWNGSSVSVTGDANVTGNLTATNMPSIGYTQSAQTVQIGNSLTTLTSQTVSKRATGYFYITCFIAGSFNNNTVYMNLYDWTSPTNPIDLAFTLQQGSVGSESLSWVVPVTSVGGSQTFTLTSYTDTGTATIYNYNLSVVFIPRAN